MGAAYEYLIKYFADSAGKKAGEFYTPSGVVTLLTKILDPKPGMSIYDPTVGSDGMLIQAKEHIKEIYNSDNFSLYGQDTITTTWAMCNWFTLGNKKQKKAKELFKAWYSGHLKNKIDERFQIICQSANISQPDLRIMELGFRWGSCTKEGVLNFNWKIAMAPIGVIDYFIVHELVYLKINTHNEKFWKEVSKVIPNYLEKKSGYEIMGICWIFRGFNPS